MLPPLLLLLLVQLGEEVGSSKEVIRIPLCVSYLGGGEEKELLLLLLLLLLPREHIRKGNWLEDLAIKVAAG